MTVSTHNAHNGSMPPSNQPPQSHGDWLTHPWAVLMAIVCVYGPWTWLCVWLAFGLYQPLLTGNQAALGQLITPLLIGVSSPIIGWLIIFVATGLQQCWKHQPTPQPTDVNRTNTALACLPSWSAHKLIDWGFRPINASTLIRYTVIGAICLWGWSLGLNYLSQWLGNSPSVSSILPDQLFSLWGMVIIVAIIPFSEELIFRGAFQSALHHWQPFTQKPLVVITLTALVFTLLHGGYWSNPLALINTLALGMGLSGLRVVSRSSWPGVVLHTLNNAMVYITASNLS